ncbi:hypothetical protein FBU30_006736 [Linnemannia zychae]|nr:hypothetical protein FBU30_006736 [Linnemannia zychae]
MVLRPASERFRDIPELIYMVASYLDRNEIISLQLTCRMMYSICHPFIYRDIWLSGISSEETMRLVARHAQHVTALGMEGDECSQYYQAMVHVLHNPPTGPSSSHAGCHPFIVASNLNPASMSHQLVWNIEHQSVLSDDALDTLCHFNSLAAQLFYAIRFSWHLTSLTLSFVTIRSDRELFFLARVFSHIVTLEQFYFECFSDNVAPETLLTTMIHSCPPRVEKLSILADRLHSSEPSAPSLGSMLNNHPIEHDFLAVSSPIPTRQEPLRRLKELEVKLLDDMVFAQTYLSILEFLPALETMDIPPVGSDLHEAAHHIAKCCPNLRHLNSANPIFDRHGDMALEILKTTRKNTLETFSFLEFEGQNRKFNRGFRCHSNSLRSIIFDTCQTIKTSIVCGILFECSNLEVFKITTDYDSNIDIPLRNIVEKPWASTKFKELQLILSMDNSIACDRDHFMHTTLPDEWEPVLRSFYEQLGALTELRVLDLRAKEDIERTQDGDIYYHKLYSFPGMLTLCNESAHREGFLQLLGGLSHLEILTGSFNYEEMLPGYELQDAEAIWIAQHWPNLKTIELYTGSWSQASLDTRPPIMLLTQLLPHLSIVAPDDH